MFPSARANTGETPDALEGTRSLIRNPAVRDTRPIETQPYGTLGHTIMMLSAVLTT